MDEFTRFRHQRKQRGTRRMPIKLWLLALGLIVGGTVGYFVYGLPPGSFERFDLWPSGAEGQVTFHLCNVALQRNCVIDGDTIRYGGEKIRLADIDTPEIFSPRCDYEEALGQKAKHRLLELLNSGTVHVVRAGRRNKDRYKRLLRVVKIDGRSVGDILIAEGLARRWKGARRSWC